MSGAWGTVGTIASTAGVTTAAIGGAKTIMSTYQTYASPYTSLTESGRKLKRVRSRLQGLSPKRREEIEIASRSDSFRFSSLRILEKQLEDLTDVHCRLSKGIEETTFTERHFPYSEFRSNLSRFEGTARGLLNDTLKTTVPDLDDLMFNPENSTRAMERSSSSKSTFNPENSTRATERPSSAESTFNPEVPMQAMERSSSSKSTFHLGISTRAAERFSSSKSTSNPEISTRAMERSSSSKLTFNPEISRWAMKGSSSSELREDRKTARESFSDLVDIPLSPGRMV